MIKTQVQIPDHLYREAKRIAHDYELSFAEVVRRGLERMVPSYPRRDQNVPWSAPIPVALKLRCRIDHDEWRLLANEPDYTPRHLRR